MCRVKTISYICYGRWWTWSIHMCVYTRIIARCSWARDIFRAVEFRVCVWVWCVGICIYMLHIRVHARSQKGHRNQFLAIERPRYAFQIAQNSTPFCAAHKHNTHKKHMRNAHPLNVRALSACGRVWRTHECVIAFLSRSWRSWNLSSPQSTHKRTNSARFRYLVKHFNVSSISETSYYEFAFENCCLLRPVSMLTYCTVWK